MILGEAEQAGPVYALVKRVRSSSAHPFVRAVFELSRWDGVSERTNWETIAQGEGLAARLRIVTFLRDLAEVDGPDAGAALAALRAGWSTVRVPPAPEADLS